MDPNARVGVDAKQHSCVEASGIPVYAEPVLCFSDTQIDRRERFDLGALLIQAEADADSIADLVGDGWIDVEVEGLDLRGNSLDRPSQSEEYSVLRPNGTFTPKPKFQRGPRSIAKSMLGTKAVSPAFPPSAPSGRAPGATLARLENFVDGEISVACDGEVAVRSADAQIRPDSTTR